MISEEDYNRLSDISYWIDSKKDDVLFHPKTGTTLNPADIKDLSQKYKVLKVEDNIDKGM